MFVGMARTYVAGFIMGNALLGIALLVLLRFRRKWKRQHPVRVRWCNLFLSAWSLAAVLSGIEFYFAFIYDQSDSLNLTRVSQLWFARHVNPYRNSDGFRDSHEIPRVLPVGTRHLCFLGDSFTMGHGIRRMQDRFSDIVAAEFEHRRPGAFVVSNAGEIGDDVSKIRQRLSEFLKQDRPLDVVVYVCTLNDIEPFEPRTKELSQPVIAAFPEFWLFTRTYSWNWFYCRYLQFTRPEISNYFSYLRESYDSPAWDKFAAEFVGIAEVCREHQTDFRVAIFPFVHNLGPDYPFREAHRKLSEHCRGLGTRVLDLTADLEPHAPEGLTVNRFDAHPNEMAHKIAAQAMCDKLLDDLLVEDKSADQK